MGVLKPCPFCGAKEPIVQINTRNGIDKKVICHFGEGGCGACVGWYQKKEDLIKAWNQRVKRVKYD